MAKRRRGPTWAVGGLQLRQRAVWLDGVAHVVTETGSGPALVLVHGLGGSWRWWARNVPGLAERFTVHLVDLTGFGENRREQRFSLAEAPAQLAALLRHFDVGPVTLVGHSMGGAIALRMAVDHPDLVARLVLVSPALLPHDYASPRQAVELARGLRRLPFDFLPTMASDFFRSGPRTMLRATWQLIRTLAPDNLTSVPAPTLIVWGNHDTVVPLTVGQELAQRLPNARLEVLPRAGHIPMWERPDDFNRLVIAFATDGSAPAMPEASGASPEIAPPAAS